MSTSCPPRSPDHNARRGLAERNADVWRALAAAWPGTRPARLIDIEGRGLSDGLGVFGPGHHGAFIPRTGGMSAGLNRIFTRTAKTALGIRAAIHCRSTFAGFITAIWASLHPVQHADAANEIWCSVAVCRGRAARGPRTD